MRGDFPWDEDPEVNENVVVCSFMPNTSSSATLRPCRAGYRLHCGDTRFQLYDKGIGNTFVFIQRAPSMSGFELMTSIALQKITATVQRVTMSFMLSGQFFLTRLICLIQVAAWSSPAHANHCSWIACCVQPWPCCTSIVWSMVRTVRSFLIRFKTVVSQRKLAFQQKSTFDVSNASQLLIVLTIFKMSTGTPTRTLGWRVHFIGIPLKKWN